MKSCSESSEFWICNWQCEQKLQREKDTAVIWKGKQQQQKKADAPMIEMGFLMKRRRPLMPAYLLRQPADHSRTRYSEPKNSTSTISCRATEHNMRDWELARDNRGYGMKTWAAWEWEKRNEGLFLEKKRRNKAMKEEIKLGQATLPWIYSHMSE